jgi:hypothetical protein
LKWLNGKQAGDSDRTKVSMNNNHTRTSTMPAVRFSLGQILATPGALETLEDSDQSPGDFLTRHMRGDWGELCEDDRQLNDEAIKDGSRILSAYRTLKGKKIWIITEATDEQGKRVATTILLPEEY